MSQDPFSGVSGPGRRSLLGLAAVVSCALFVFPAPLHAQEQRAQTPSDAEGYPVTQGQAKAESYFKSFDPVVTFTDQQKTAVTDLCVALFQSRSQFKKQNAAAIKAIFDAMKKASDNGDEEGVSHWNSERNGLFAPQYELEQDYEKRIFAVLTYAQKAKFRERILTRVIPQLCQPVELTVQQMKAVKAAVADWEPETFHDMGPITELRQEVQEIMTPEQKSRFIKACARSYVDCYDRGLNLTQKQRKKAEALCDQLAQDPDLEPRDLEERLSGPFIELLNSEQKQMIGKSPWLSTLRRWYQPKEISGGGLRGRS